MEKKGGAFIVVANDHLGEGPLLRLATQLYGGHVGPKDQKEIRVD